ncbi:MAG TPA: SDR family NAD(P)-dependent oxidoreductase [Aggregatilineaceae bacterium]|nr:SDR family NAD(P)-dependent oxidoreductase [Aggregatilineaceae bacterium]
MKRLGRRLFWGGSVISGGYWVFRYLRPQHSTLMLNDQVVIITGASMGIGRALAFAFARRGARMVLVARNAERLEAVRREIEPYTADVLVLAADITVDEQLEQVVQRTLDTFGRVDVVVNNAGQTLGGWLYEQDAQKIAQLIDVNLKAAIRLTQLVLPHMLKQHHGFIMNVASEAGRTATPLYSAYVASKYGLAGFTDALRREVDGTGLYLTLVLPSWTQTDMIPTALIDLLERRGFRIYTPDEVAERAILGLVHGENEVIIGDWMVRLGIWVERYAPILLRLYWRLAMTPEWIAAVNRVGRE